MSAPLTLTTPATASSAISGAGNAAVSLNPLTDTLFASMLSAGLPSLTMTAPTTLVDGKAANSAEGIPVAVNSSAANADAKSKLAFQKALFVSVADLNSMSNQDLESLLSNLGDTSDELTPKILLALTPGVPAKEVLDNIKAKFTDVKIDASSLADLGIDTSTFEKLGIDASSLQSITVAKVSNPLKALSTVSSDADTTNASVVADKGLTIETSDATEASNLLLITTGFSPSQMGILKDAIKSISEHIKGNPKGHLSENNLDESGLSGSNDATTPLKDNSTDVNASAAIVMMVFITPAPKLDIVPAAADLSFDLSALSAFTQPTGKNIQEPDWTKKLSDKLGSMSLTDTNSAFDDEMNEILSPTTPKEMAFNFKAETVGVVPQKKENIIKANKEITTDVSPQATIASNHLANLGSTATQSVASDGTFMINGNMISAQNMSSPLTNPIFTSASAIGTHPSIHAVAQIIEKAASGSEKASQELTVQLDPPELGRMQVQLSLEKDGVMKVHLLTEKQETLSLFQRDAHALKHALDSVGLKIDSSSLTFDLASGGDQSFQQLMGGSQNNSQSGNGQSSSRLMEIGEGVVNATDSMMIDTKMDFTPNAITGNVHYSFLA